MLMRKLVPHFAPCWHDYYTTKVSMELLYKSGNQHFNKLTDNDFNKLATLIILLQLPKSYTYYAGIMLDTFNNLRIMLKIMLA